MHAQRTLNVATELADLRERRASTFRCSTMSRETLARTSGGSFTFLVNREGDSNSCSFMRIT
jgi:hypothetical protein